MAISTPSMQELLEAGVHFGHQVRRGHPRMKTYIYGVRDGVHILDLAKSEEMLKSATEAAYNLGKEGKVLLVVGTKKQAREIVEKAAQEAGTPYLISHWVGGLLTNFDEIKKNVKKLKDLKEEKEKGTLSRYTKKEQLLMSRKLEKFNSVLGGVADMDKIPDAIFIVDTVAENTAVKEAQRVGIVSLGMADTNSNPDDLDHPIASNDDGIKSIKLVVETVIGAYAKGKKEAKGIADKKAEDDEKKAKEEETQLAEETAAIEEEIEKKTVESSSRKES